MPAVSVVLPVRDGERYIAQAIASVQGQTFPDWELVVVDDGSTDATPEVLRAAAEADGRVRVHRQERTGLGPALRLGCSVAAAALIARMDADDICRPERLERQLDLLARRPTVALVGAGVLYVDPLARPVKPAIPPADDDAIKQRLEVETVFFHPTVVFRRTAYEAVGGYRDVAVPAEDLDLWLRLAEHYELANVPEPLLDYRLHAGQQLVVGASRTARAVLAVRASAAARRRGQDDPLTGLDRLDDGALARLGVSARDLRREECAALLYAARKLEQAGDARTAADLRRHADRLCPDPTPRAVRRLRAVVRRVRRSTDERRPAAD